MKLPPNVSEWLNLLTRWFHIFAAILWVGTTYYFTWLDARFHDEEGPAGSVDEKVEVWMVHSGGFYVVEKRKTPSLRRLHWFRWEAMLTWLSGMLMLTIVYYMGGVMVDPDVRDISVTTAVLFGLGMLTVGWIVYDLLVQSPLGRNERAFAVVAYALVVGAAYLSTHVLSGRAAYLHVGATFGTIMAANVWMRILPAQRRMIAAVQDRGPPDPPPSGARKTPPEHNTLSGVPPCFTPISHHQPHS